MASRENGATLVWRRFGRTWEDRLDDGNKQGRIGMITEGEAYRETYPNITTPSLDTFV
jgi:hypothetical protein